MANKKPPEVEGPSTDVVLRAMFAVLAADRDSRENGTPHRRTELLLADVGIGYKDIATLLGKKPDAVRMLLSRAQSTK